MIYNFDSTGLSTDNRIPGEKHTVSTVSSGRNNYFVPKFTPFFEAGLTVIDDQSGLPLKPGIDFVLTHKYQDAIDNINLSVYGSITLVDTSRTGTYTIAYQTLGGPFITPTGTVIESGLALLHDLTTIDFSEITNVPETFPPTPHNHNVSGVDAVDELLNQVILMRQALENPNTELSVRDITDLDERFIQPMTDGIQAIADAIITKAATTNIPFEISTPGRSVTSLGPINIGAWKDTTLSCAPAVTGSYKIDMDVNVTLAEPTKDDIIVEKRWVVNDSVIDRSYSNHTVVGLAKGDIVRLQLRLRDGSASDVVVAGPGHSSSLTITRLGN